MSLDIILTETVPTEVFSTNITHNLGAMAEEAGIYHALWRPEEHGFNKARDIIPALESGVFLLASDPARFKKFDAENGWGTYDQFLPWVREVLAACKEHPGAELRVSR